VTGGGRLGANVGLAVVSKLGALGLPSGVVSVDSALLVIRAQVLGPGGHVVIDTVSPFCGTQIKSSTLAGRK
jgi:hypothetical protein